MIIIIVFYFNFAFRKAKNQRIKSDKSENALKTTKFKSKSSKSPNTLYSKTDHSKGVEAKDKDENVPGNSGKEPPGKSLASEEVEATSESSPGDRKDTTETEETPGNSRRSGRIARNQDKMDEKKKEQEELEKKLMVQFFIHCIKTNLF